MKNCISCKFLGYEPAGWDNPNPEIWCEKDHWAGCDNYEALKEENNCSDYEPKFIETNMMRTINELLMLGKKEFNNPSNKSGQYHGICEVYCRLKGNKAITLKEYVIIKDYLKKNLPQKRYYGKYCVAGRLYCWKPFLMQGRNRWFDKNIELTNTCEFGEHLPLSSAGMIVCSRCGKTLVDY